MPGAAAPGRLSAYSRGRSRPAVGLLLRPAGQHQVVVARVVQAEGAAVGELLDTRVDSHAQAVWQHREPEQGERPEPDSAGAAGLQPGPDEDLVELAQPVRRDRGTRGRLADPRCCESPLGAGAGAIEGWAVPWIEQQAEPVAIAGVQQQVTARRRTRAISSAATCAEFSHGTTPSATTRLNVSAANGSR